eukprot:CAMPEP_0175071218 /NCGR_PEP_ID=MMETSP0052_2-20121109/19130_1 /TAXON_ID=51329 ORGANISM="Polytomella parva, Strain SAG 63-3" /NCGR_SAMPLE_ID=MMETSP0052_2 /ASSEMBLY_ACC=CAM_ASM_000194 /LENGTH=1671 /DNA_ID=CAMNT_0016338383 /DNA_START=135 /DNA_END=5147 /DNA_ORIENTATION=-
MFGKFASGLKRAGKSSGGFKYKYDVEILSVENLPTSARKCRVVWARSSKVAMTDVKDVSAKGKASFSNTLTQNVTVFRTKTGFEAKDYEFRVQVPRKQNDFLTIGKTKVDVSKYIAEGNSSTEDTIKVAFKVGTSSTGYVKIRVHTTFLTETDDATTVASGITGATSDNTSREQDLSGFDDATSSRNKSSNSDKVGESGDEATSRFSGKSTSKSGKDSGKSKFSEIEEVSDEDKSPGRKKDSSATVAKKGAVSASRKGSIPDDEGDARSALFSKKSTGAGRGSAKDNDIENAFRSKDAVREAMNKSTPKVFDSDEDISPMNSDVSDGEETREEAAARRRMGKGVGGGKDLDSMKNSLFGPSKASSSSNPSSVGKSVASPRSTSAAPPSSSSSAATATRTRSIEAPSAAAGAKKGGGAKRLPPPPPENETQESDLRNSLFAVAPSGPAKKTAAAAAGAKKRPVKTEDFGSGSDSGAEAPPSRPNGVGGKGMSKKKASEDLGDEEDEEDEEVRRGGEGGAFSKGREMSGKKKVEGSASKANGSKAFKGGPRNGDTDDDDGDGDGNDLSEGEDENGARDLLFGVKSSKSNKNNAGKGKNATAVAANNNKAKGKESSSGKSPLIDSDGNEDEEDDYLFDTSRSKSKSKSKDSDNTGSSNSFKSKLKDRLDQDSGDEFASENEKKAPTKTVKGRASMDPVREAKGEESEEEDDLLGGRGGGEGNAKSRKGPLSSESKSMAAGVKRPGMGSKNGTGNSGQADVATLNSGGGNSAGNGGGKETEALRKRVSDLEQQLDSERREKKSLEAEVAQLKQQVVKLQAEIDKSDDLEGMYKQMLEMETKFKNELEDAENKHLDELDEIEEQYKNEIETLKRELTAAKKTGSSGSGGGGGDSKALEALQKTIETLKNELEESKKSLEEADKIANEVQDENDELQNEMDNLKKQLEEAKAAAAAAAANSNGSGGGSTAAARRRNRRGSVDGDFEGEEARKKLEEENKALKNENERLKEDIKDLEEEVDALKDDLDDSEKKRQELEKSRFDPGTPSATSNASSSVAPPSTSAATAAAATAPFLPTPLDQRAANAVSAATAELESLLYVKAQADTKVSVLQIEKDRLSAEVARLTQERSTSQGEHTRLLAEVDRLRDEVQELADALDASLVSKDRLEQENVKLLKQLEHLNARQDRELQSWQQRQEQRQQDLLLSWQQHKEQDLQLKQNRFERDLHEQMERQQRLWEMQRDEEMREKLKSQTEARIVADVALRTSEWERREGEKLRKETEEKVVATLQKQFETNSKAMQEELKRAYEQETASLQKEFEERLVALKGELQRLKEEGKAQQGGSGGGGGGGGSLGSGVNFSQARPNSNSNANNNNNNNNNKGNMDEMNPSGARTAVTPLMAANQKVLSEPNGKQVVASQLISPSGARRNHLLSGAASRFKLGSTLQGRRQGLGEFSTLTRTAAEGGGGSFFEGGGEMEGDGDVAAATAAVVGGIAGIKGSLLRRKKKQEDPISRALRRTAIKSEAGDLSIATIERYQLLQALGDILPPSVRTVHAEDILQRHHTEQHLPMRLKQVMTSAALQYPAYAAKYYAPENAALVAFFADRTEHLVDSGLPIAMNFSVFVERAQKVAPASLELPQKVYTMHHSLAEQVEAPRKYRYLFTKDGSAVKNSPDCDLAI